MNPHDRRNPQPSDTQKTDDDFEIKSSTTDSIEVSTQTKPKAFRNTTTWTRQERAANILALLLIQKQLKLNDRLQQMTGRHSESSFRGYIFSVIRGKK